MKQYPPEHWECVVLGRQTFYLRRDGENSRRIAWRKMARKTVAAFAQAHIDFYGIKTTKDLQYGPHRRTGLLTYLQHKKLIAFVFRRPAKIERIIGGEKFIIPLKTDGKVDWQKMGNKKALRYICAHVKESGIKHSSDLQRGPRKNPGMHKKMEQSGWLDIVFPHPKEKIVRVNGKEFTIPLLPDGKMHLDPLTNDYFSEYFHAVCAEHNIKTRTELKRFGTLAHQERKRKLTLLPDRRQNFERAGQIFSLPMKGKRIMWSVAGSRLRRDFCVAHCLEFDITIPSDLAHGPHRMNGLYKAMSANHELHAAFGLPDRRYELLDGDLYCLWLQTDHDIDWERSGEKMLFNYACAFLRHNGLTRRSELEKTDSSFLMILARRQLLRRLFPPTRRTITLFGRRFILPQKGRYVQWREMDRTVLSIYAACAWRQCGRLRDLPCQVKKLMNHAIARQYRQRLPTLDNDTAKHLRDRFGVRNNYDLPDEILWAYGYEKYDDQRIRAKCLRKIEPPLEPID